MIFSVGRFFYAVCEVTPNNTAHNLMDLIHLGDAIDNGFCYPLLNLSLVLSNGYNKNYSCGVNCPIRYGYIELSFNGSQRQSKSFQDNALI